MSMTTKTKTPTELLPAYERPIDRESIDRRMSDHLTWENSNRITPRTEIVVTGGDKKEVPIKVKKIAKKAATLALAGVLAAGAVKGIGNAVDHELDTGRPNIDNPDGMYNTSVDSEGNIIRTYPGSVDK